MGAAGEGGGRGPDLAREPRLAMDPRSEQNLLGVHPDLARVARQVSALPSCEFLVIHGRRTAQEEAAMVAGGHSQTLHSRHLPNKEGYACAIDVAALDEGHVSWSAPLYEAIASDFKRTATVMGIPVEWGGDWDTFKDLGHFQLPWQEYP